MAETDQVPAWSQTAELGLPLGRASRREPAEAGWGSQLHSYLARVLRPTFMGGTSITTDLTASDSTAPTSAGGAQAATSVLTTVDGSDTPSVAADETVPSRRPTRRAPGPPSRSTSPASRPVRALGSSLDPGPSCLRRSRPTTTGTPAATSRSGTWPAHADGARDGRPARAGWRWS